MTTTKKVIFTLFLALAVYLIGLSLERYVVKPAEIVSQAKAPQVKSSATAINPTDALFAATLNDANGNPVALSSYKGKVLIVNFWATWCPPCREEMPELSELSIELAAKNIALIGIAVDDAQSIKDFQKETPVANPLLEAEVEGAPMATGLGNDKGVLPFTVVIDANGRLIKSFFGKVSKAQLLASLAQ